MYELPRPLYGLAEYICIPKEGSIRLGVNLISCTFFLFFVQRCKVVVRNSNVSSLLYYRLYHSEVVIGGWRYPTNKTLPDSFVPKATTPYFGHYQDDHPRQHSHLNQKKTHSTRDQSTFVGVSQLFVACVSVV